MSTHYCSNDDSEAVNFYVGDSGEKVYLCYPCSTAFEWGQNNPGATLVDVYNDDDISDNELEDFANLFQSLPDECRMILGSGESLEKFALTDTDGIRWSKTSKSIAEYNTGSTTVYGIPDWDEMRRDIISNYEIEKPSDIRDAFAEEIIAYQLYSRG